MAITASAMGGDEDRAREAGADAYLTKPLAAPVFHAILRRLLSPSPTGD